MTLVYATILCVGMLGVSSLIALLVVFASELSSQISRREE